MKEKPIIVVSATRFFQGGTIVIVNECLKFLSKNYRDNYTIKALVYDKSLYESIEAVEWVNFPNSRKTIFHRLYDEYIGFKKLSKSWKPVRWLSLQDSTPNVDAQIRAVYFHNPLLLKPKELNLLRHQPRLEVLRLLYKYIYTKGIRKNDMVITQQLNIATYLKDHYNIETDRVRVFPPVNYLLNRGNTTTEKGDLLNPAVHRYSPGNRVQDPFTFIYPATAFYYKNHDLILQACRLLKARQISNFRVLLTIDGSENGQVRQLVTQAKLDLPEIEFLGFLKREKVFDYYLESDAMVFPSLLESWGLPLTEFAGLDKPILCADLPYAHETLENYSKACFFDPNNANALAKLMEEAINGSINYPAKPPIKKSEGLSQTQYLKTWEELFKLLLGTGN